MIKQKTYKHFTTLIKPLSFSSFSFSKRGYIKNPYSYILHNKIPNDVYISLPIYASGGCAGSYRVLKYQQIFNNSKIIYKEFYNEFRNLKDDREEKSDNLDEKTLLSINVHKQKLFYTNLPIQDLEILSMEKDGDIIPPQLKKKLIFYEKQINAFIRQETLDIDDYVVDVRASWNKKFYDQHNKLFKMLSDFETPNFPFVEIHAIFYPVIKKMHEAYFTLIFARYCRFIPRVLTHLRPHASIYFIQTHLIDEINNNDDGFKEKLYAAFFNLRNLKVLKDVIDMPSNDPAYIPWEDLRNYDATEDSSGRMVIPVFKGKSKVLFKFIVYLKTYAKIIRTHSSYDPANEYYLLNMIGNKPDLYFQYYYRESKKYYNKYFGFGENANFNKYICSEDNHHVLNKKTYVHLDTIDNNFIRSKFIDLVPPPALRKTLERASARGFDLSKLLILVKQGQNLGWHSDHLLLILIKGSLNSREWPYWVMLKDYAYEDPKFLTNPIFNFNPELIMFYLLMDDDLFYKESLKYISIFESLRYISIFQPLEYISILENENEQFSEHLFYWHSWYTWYMRGNAHHSKLHTVYPIYEGIEKSSNVIPLKMSRQHGASHLLSYRQLFLDNFNKNTYFVTVKRECYAAVFPLIFTLKQEYCYKKIMLIYKFHNPLYYNDLLPPLHKNE